MIPAKVGHGPRRARNKIPRPTIVTADWALELKRVRALAGLSQEEFAYALPVPQRTLARWESGETKPSALVKIRVHELRKLFEHARRTCRKGTVRLWLKEPTDMLDGASALDVLRRPGGIQTVDDHLGRMEWGITP